MDTVGFKVLLVLLSLKVHYNFAQQTNYVKPHGNTTCPGYPCLTLQEYAEAASTYFVSSIDFVFITGNHYLDVNVNLTNLSFVHFQGGSENNTSHIFFMPLAKLMFTTCHNITFSHLFITLTGSRIGFSRTGFSSIEFQNSAAVLNDLVFQGTRYRLYSRALFVNVSNIKISDLRVEKAISVYGAAILVHKSTLHISGDNYFCHNIVMLNGGVLFSRDSNITFSGSNIFEGNTVLRFSGGAVYVVESNINFSGKTHFLHNVAKRSGGGAITSYKSKLFLSGATFKDNHAFLFGGALSCGRNSHVTIEDTLVVGNSAGGTGGAIDITGGVLNFKRKNSIENNWSVAGGGGVSFFNASQLSFSGINYFRNNTSNGIGGGLYVSLSDVLVDGLLLFVNNHGHDGGAVVGMSAKLDIDLQSNLTFERNYALNKGGAILNIDTTWNVKGSQTFVKNTATMGGAMCLIGISKLSLNKHSSLTFINNRALHYGGAIYVNELQSIDECKAHKEILSAFCYIPNSTRRQMCKRLKDCFLELNIAMPFNVSSSDKSMVFANNFAGRSGSVIFGGSLDNCRLYLGGGLQDDCGNIVGREYTDENSLQIFLMISTISNMSSAISSEPFRICFCKNGLPHCDLTPSVDTVRGRKFTLSAVTVGQGNFTVPSLIKADFDDSSDAWMSHLDQVQSTGHTCTDISFRIYSDASFVTLILFPDGPCRDTGIARREVNVTFLPCPDGFVKVGTECLCDKRLHAFNVSCDVDDGSIRRLTNSFWVRGIYDNFSYRGILLHKSRCPLDYCVETPIEILLDNPDVQCNHNHSGVLCGSCVDGFSLALGTLHCLSSCSNYHLFLLLPLALAGLLLVVVLMLLRLTVAHGTMNGLIFYANVVQVNRGIFFSSGDDNILTIFIAWVNLDLGVETCFYHGMDTYTFVWLQFAFPFYVWFLIGLIIVICRHSRTVAKVLGSNPVSVLATLLLISYSKILRTIILSLSRTSLQYPNRSYRHVWLYDGNVPYFETADHIALGVFAVIALIFLFLPYTFLLLCGTRIQAYSHWKSFSWINKVKPLMDAYYAPYKKENRYWTGFLLLVRCVLFLTFTFNALGSASVNLLTITSVSVGLTALAWLQKGLYEKIYNDILEAVFMLNLCIFAVATYHVKESSGSQSKLAYISVGLSFVIFLGIVGYHVYLCVLKTACWKKLNLPKSTTLQYVRHFFKQRKESNENQGVDDVDWSPIHVISDTVNPPSSVVVELNEPLLE